jgi:hypothetical protein
MVRQPGQGRGRRGGLLLAIGIALLLLAATAGGATLAPGLDHDYGQDGVAQVPAELFTDFEGFSAAADGDAFVFGRAWGGRREEEFILRFDHAGRRDMAYGRGGKVVLPSQSIGYRAYAVFADHAARVVAGAVLGDRVILRRFTIEGHPDPSFGKNGFESVPCDCDGMKLRLFEIGDGRILLELQREASRGSIYGAATKVRLTELLPDGRLDHGFGRAGSVAFKIPRRAPLRAVAPTPGGAILLGGPGRAVNIPVYLWRVTADGRVDHAFARAAESSVRQLGVSGKSPELAAIIPTAHGGVAAIGSIDEEHGFLLRLQADGQPDRGLAGRGAKRLPFTVQGALGGRQGAVFAVGRGRGGYRYRAFRILSGGALDPRYGGARGRAVPLPGAGVQVFSQGAGRVLVAGMGRTYCRSGCGPHPALTRFRE